ncbi:MAG: dienelactone hydrolase family protein [Acidimicrobiia bacterium]|nr:dienelactone hydrolase family protein [Acidimicrobiia bacterium]
MTGSPPVPNPASRPIRPAVVEWRPGHGVPALLEGPAESALPAILLASGAGAGQGHPFLTGLRHRLAAAGHLVMTFDYPYAAVGRRAPDRLEVLLECHRAAAGLLRAAAPEVALAGKSMGGRVASHLAAQGEPCSGVLCFGYPLVPVGKTAARDTTHLEAIRVPMLFVRGSRDRLAPLALLGPLVARLPRAELVVVDGADHSFGVRAVPDARGEAGLDLLAGRALEWLRGPARAMHGR